jgi:hypothetical protein
MTKLKLVKNKCSGVRVCVPKFGSAALLICSVKLSINHLKHSGNYNVPPALVYKNFAFCPYSAFVFCMILTINSDWFPKQH